MTKPIRRNRRERKYSYPLGTFPIIELPQCRPQKEFFSIRILSNGTTDCPLWIAVSCTILPPFLLKK